VSSGTWDQNALVPSVVLRNRLQVLHSFGKLIKRRKDLGGGGILVPIFLAILKTIFFQKKGKMTFFLRKTSIFDPKNDSERADGTRAF
jgi:hypothetical protein